jgi:prophage antirepressor-like protein
LNYKGNRIDARAMEGQLWLKAGQIVQPLGFASVDSVLKIVQRYPEEFGPEESRIIPLPTPSSGLQPTRAFSLRGVRLLCLLARTEPARAFRRWILDLLEGRVQLPDASERRAEVENAPLSTDARRVLESIAAWPEADSALVEKIRLALSSGGGLQRAPKLETAARRFLAFAAAQRVHMKEFGAIRATAARDGYSMEAVKAEARRIRAMENGQGTLSLPHA